MTNEKLLKFESKTCQPCKMLAKNLEGADIGVPIEVLDIDVHQDLLPAYNIRGVPTLVHIPSMQSISGVHTAEEIKQWLEKCRA